VCAPLTAAAGADVQAADGVAVTTDATTYLPGDPISVTITNGGSDRITRGGLDCDPLWPLALEQLQSDGSWQALPRPPSSGCIGIAGVLVPPGGTQTHQISLTLDPGTYHVVYSFSVVGDGQLTSYSEPFTILDPSDSGE